MLTDSDLKFNVHVNSICAKAHARVSLLFRGFLSHDHHLLVTAYKVYVLPLLEYCSVVWSPLQKGLINAFKTFSGILPGNLFGLIVCLMQNV